MRLVSEAFPPAIAERPCRTFPPRYSARLPFGLETQPFGQAAIGRCAGGKVPGELAGVAESNRPVAHFLDEDPVDRIGHAPAGEASLENGVHDCGAHAYETPVEADLGPGRVGLNGQAQGEGRWFGQATERYAQRYRHAGPVSVDGAAPAGREERQEQ